ncbi:MAG: hypothetical protein IJP86_05290 [Synergistaceae bacterium]|nr:hypothetical protein [Synergistaceae bacterium]
MSESSECEKVLWVFDMVDNKGQFAFDVNREDFEHRNFLEKLPAYSRMTWAEVRRQTHECGKSNHHYLTEVSRLSRAAQDRIKQLGLEGDTDRIYSFSLDNMLRIIGLRDREKFHALWYDARHEVYPVSR